MFANLTQKLSSTFQGLRRKGLLTEADVDAALREIRIALLEADVALPVVKEFVAQLKEQAIGQKIISSVSPAQMMVKLTHDQLISLLGDDNQALKQPTNPPMVILMCGLQGSGKTTTTGKLALRLRTKYNYRVMVASLDIYRPAAQEQLAQVAARAQVAALPIISGQTPQQITQRALAAARTEGMDILLLDTAGRLHVDDELMAELAAVRDLAKPLETLLVADSLTGQDAVNIAKQFHEKIGVSGIILTRTEGDGRGGAALSMRQVTGQPIKFLGTGEGLEALEEFHASRVAGRILDMGDVISLVEKAVSVVDEAQMKQAAERMEKGLFTMEDLLTQLRNMNKMGGISSMLGLLPGMGALKEKIDGAKIDESLLKRQEAMILSMTRDERNFPKKINGQRRIRIAKGSGTQVQDVNKLLKQFFQMEDMVKKMQKMGKKGIARGGLQQLFKGMVPH